MTAYLHLFFVTWLNWVESGGYVAVFFLMAMESSIFPVPSEIVIPPAAFLAAQGRLDFWGVVLAGTFGSLFGSVLTYWASKILGVPFLKNYGRYFFLPWHKVEALLPLTERHGAWIIFVARFLPVVRHFISIPAGIFSIPIKKFVVSTTVGAFGWCTILAFVGEEILLSHPEMMQSPQEMIRGMKSALPLVAVFALFLLLLYFFIQKKIFNSRQIKH